MIVLFYDYANVKPPRENEIVFFFLTSMKCAQSEDINFELIRNHFKQNHFITFGD